MERRQEEHRKRSEEPPSIVIIADEMADLIFTSKEAENNIVQLAQPRRAVGIHLVLATRLENVNVLTGYVKAQIPTRIAFAIASEPENRDALDRAIDVILERFATAGQTFNAELRQISHRPESR